VSRFDQIATAPHLEQIGGYRGRALYGVRPATRSRGGQDRRQRRAHELATLGIGIAVLILVSAGVDYTCWHALKAKNRGPASDRGSIIVQTIAYQSASSGSPAAVA